MVLFYFLFLISCAPVRVACVGDSITYGSGIKGRDSLAYPQQLQKKLGKKYLTDAKKNIDDKNKFYEALDKAMMNYLKSILLFDNSEFNVKKLKEALLKKSVSLKTIDLVEDIFNNCQIARYTPFDQVEMDKDYSRALEVLSLIDKEIK